MKKEMKKGCCGDSIKKDDKNIDVKGCCKGKEEANMKVSPLADRVLIKPLEAEEKTKGGIIIPDAAKEKPQQGKIVSVGKGKLDNSGTLIPLETKVGDKVLYGRYSGTEIKIDGEEYLIVREDDILAIIS